MSEYYLILIWIALMALISVNVQIMVSEKVDNKIVSKVSWTFIIIFCIPLVWWCTQRTVADTYAYIRTYQNLPSTITGIIENYQNLSKDKMFYTFESIIKLFIGDNYKVYFGILATFQLFSLTQLYRDYSENFVMAMFIFVASTDYYSWMQNGIRQFTAVTIILFATKWIINKKYIPAIITILIAAQFHRSALLMIPIIFIVQGDAWNWKTIAAIIISSIAIVFIENFTSILDNFLQETQYENVVSDWQSWQDNGTSPIRVLVYSVPTIMSFIGLKYIKEENNLVINIACNMGIMSTVLYVISMFTSGIFIGRLPIYCSLYASGILLPWEINHMFTDDSKNLLKTLLVLFYLLFYYYQMHFTWGWM